MTMTGASVNLLLLAASACGEHAVASASAAAAAAAAAATGSPMLPAYRAIATWNSAPHFSGRSVHRAASACSMQKVKLGRKEFDVDSEEINANGCLVSDADCVAFAARMRTGEISRVKRLTLVRFIVFHMQNSRLPFHRRA